MLNLNVNITIGIYLGVFFMLSPVFGNAKPFQDPNFTATCGNLNKYRCPHCTRVKQYESIIQKVARDPTVRLSPDVIRGVIINESCGNPRAKSPVGALGLMQLMPETARSLGVNDPFDPKQNILGGSRYLAFLIKWCRNTMARMGEKCTWSCIFKAYNTGPGNVRRSRGKRCEPWRSQCKYVGRILRCMQKNMKLPGSMMPRKSKALLPNVDVDSVPDTVDMENGKKLALLIKSRNSGNVPITHSGIVVYYNPKRVDITAMGTVATTGQPSCRTTTIKGVHLHSCAWSTNQVWKQEKHLKQHFMVVLRPKTSGSIRLCYRITAKSARTPVFSFPMPYTSLQTLKLNREPDRFDCLMLKYRKTNDTYSQLDQ